MEGGRAYINAEGGNKKVIETGTESGGNLVVAVHYGPHLRPQDNWCKKTTKKREAGGSQRIYIDRAS